MEIITKVVVIGIIGSVLMLLIKKTNPEFSLVMALGITGVILMIALTLYSSIAEALSLVTVSTGFSSNYVNPILKCVGIGITARLGSDLCKDSGQLAVSSAVEITGAICALYVCLPLIKTLLRMIGELT